jgi:hypothetical protein
MFEGGGGREERGEEGGRRKEEGGGRRDQRVQNLKPAVLRSYLAAKLKTRVEREKTIAVEESLFRTRVCWGGERRREEEEEERKEEEGGGRFEGRGGEDGRENFSLIKSLGTSA